MFQAFLSQEGYKSAECGFCKWEGIPNVVLVAETCVATLSGGVCCACGSCDAVSKVALNSMVQDLEVLVIVGLNISS